MNSSINNLDIRIENKVNNKITSKKIYVDGNEYVGRNNPDAGKHKIYIQSIFKSEELEYLINENDVILIDFRARTFDKILIGLLCIVITFPFFYINTLLGLYPIMPALVFLGVLKLSYNPIVIRNNKLNIRTL